MELRSRHGISGSHTKPRATSQGRKAVGTNRIDQADNVNNMTCVNSPSSPTGIARGGKSPSRILPTEGGRFRAFGPQPRSECAGGADRSPRRRGQTRESGDAGGRAMPGREPVVVAAESGKHPRQPDEGRPEFTMVPEVESLTRGSDTSSPTSARRESADYDASHSTMPTSGADFQTRLRLRNDLYCVGWSVKLYSLTHFKHGMRKRRPI